MAGPGVGVPLVLLSFLFISLASMERHQTSSTKKSLSGRISSHFPAGQPASARWIVVLFWAACLPSNADAGNGDATTRRTKIAEEWVRL
jgi:hypothetical protein